MPGGGSLDGARFGYTGFPIHTESTSSNGQSIMCSIVYLTCSLQWLLGRLLGAL